MGEKFHFVFSEEPAKKYPIDEPIDYASVDFVLEQKDGRLGRDESLNGGENKFKFVDYRNHYLDKLLYYYHKYGFEADILLVITTDLGQEYVSEMHFVDVETDEITYLECRTISKNTQQVIKSRRETNVNMFSSKDIDGNPIQPLVPINMLLQSKPTMQVSIWEQLTDSHETITARGTGADSLVFGQLNPIQNLKQSDILDSYTFFSSIEISRGFPDSQFKILSSQTSLKKVTLSIKNIDMSFETDVDNGGNGYTDFRLKVKKGIDYATATEYTLLTAYRTDHQNFSFKGDIAPLEIGELKRGESLWLFFEFKVRQSTNVTAGGAPRFEVFSTIKAGAIATLEAESTSYNSIVPTFRLIDVMKQVLKSISGSTVLSQRYDINGQFYNNVFFNGNLIRGITDKPFYVSLKDIEDFIWAEHKGDSEISESGEMFFGIEADYYTNIECGFFDDTQFDSMVKKNNQKYVLNEFGFKYGKYQSLKENTEPNSDSTIHGESIWTFFNKRAINKLSVSCEPVRDAILIDAQQRLSIKVSEDTATQDDDTIFVVDVVSSTEDFKFTEITNLFHVANGTELVLKSDGEVNFERLGIKTLSTFIIVAPNINAGTFTVKSVAQTELTLTGGTWTSSNNGAKLTTYTYEIRKEDTPLVNRTDEEFTAISNLTASEKYSNLRYSIKRNILNYWNATLATANIFNKTKPLQSTYYKNNGKCNTTYNGLTVIENESFVPKNPILSPYNYDDITFVNVDFDDYIILRNKIKKDRGFIRAINKNNRVIKVYPQKVTYVNADKKLVIIGEEKFEKAYLTITNEDGIILVNDETSLISLIWEFDVNSQEILLFDKERFRLYNGAIWDKVSVNNSVAETKEQLFSWLKLLE